MASWDAFGDIANVAQLTGIDAVSLIGMIAKAATTARMHKKNCMKFAKHLKLIGNLLEQLKISELKRYPETREPLEQLEDALRRSYILINSCQDRSFLYLLAMGWNIVYQFRKAQTEIDRYLKLVPLITLVDNARVRERLEYIEMDQHEYTLDDEDRRVQDIILKPDPCKNKASVLKKTLSSSYPHLAFNQALQKENEKLQFELQRSQAHLDVEQCEVIQHLINVTESVAASTVPEKSPSIKAKKLEHSKTMKSVQLDESFPEKCESHPPSRHLSYSKSDLELLPTEDKHSKEEWQTDLLGCCARPSLCIRTCFFPCGTFAKISSVASNKHTTSGEACNNLMAYTLLLSCCCYTCCTRRKLRQQFNITGGLVDDFLSHLLCCCCALVQEWREIEIRGYNDFAMTDVAPPQSQFMES